MGNLLAATRSMETGIKSSSEKPAAKKSVMDHRHDCAPESAIAVIDVGLTRGQGCPKSLKSSHHGDAKLDCRVTYQTGFAPLAFSKNKMRQLSHVFDG